MSPSTMSRPRAWLAAVSTPCRIEEDSPLLAYSGIVGKLDRLVANRVSYGIAAVPEHDYNFAEASPRKQVYQVIDDRRLIPGEQKLVCVVHARRTTRREDYGRDWRAVLHRPSHGQRLRLVAITSATMLTAISAGVCDPIGIPTGPRMRLISSSENPASLRRCLRLAWVRLLPRTPM